MMGRTSTTALGLALAFATAGARATDPAPDGESAVTRLARSFYAALACEPGRGLDVEDHAQHCARLEAYRAQNRAGFLELATPWIARHRPADLPPTLLYPFAGADLLTSLVVHPDAARYVHLTLDDGGPPDAFERLDPRRRKRALRTLMDDAARWLLLTGYNSTDSLRRAEKEELKGVLATTLLGLAMHGGALLELRYFEVLPSGELRYLSDEELFGGAPSLGPRESPSFRRAPRSPLHRTTRRSFELRFRLADGRERVLQHVWTNLHDTWLGRAPGAGVLAFARSLGPVAFLTKANEYNLWRPDFSIIRDVALAQSRWMISDSSGVPTRYLADTPWHIEVHGTFLCDKADIRKRNRHIRRVNDEMVRHFAEASKGPLAFRFGYGDCRNNHHLMMHFRGEVGGGR